MLTKDSGSAGLKNLDQLFRRDLCGNYRMNMIAPSIYRMHFKTPKLTAFLDRLFYYFSLLFVKREGRPFKIFLHFPFEISIGFDLRRAVDILTMDIYRTALITMKPGSIGSDRNKVSLREFVRFPIFVVHVSVGVFYTLTSVRVSAFLSASAVPKSLLDFDLNCQKNNSTRR